MKRTYTTVMIVLVLAVGIAAMFFLFNRPAAAAALPKMPIYNPSVSENATDINTIADDASLCKNIFFPLAVGAEWKYQTKMLSRSDTLNLSVLLIENSKANVLVVNESTGTTKRVEIQCDNQAITSFPFISLNALFGDLVQSGVTADYLSGVLAPNESAFLTNNWALAWESQYQTSIDTTVKSIDGQFKINIDKTPITLGCQTLAQGDAAFETITVPAGEFRALKVVCTEQGKAIATVNGIKVNTQLEGRSNQWFAPGVGLIKMQVESATIKAFGVPVSVLVDNNFELISHTPAP